MIYRLLADIIMVAHFGFILFVIAGAFLVLRKLSVMWLHLPVAAWGVIIEYMDWTCPLTPLENKLRILAGQNGIGDSFTEHYIFPLIYPEGLTNTQQIVLGSFVLALNATIYFFVWRKWRRSRD
ncbi:MAG: DUF2784 domain-containing protein [Verrucomicrobia bacterium]|nr:DUF2784 domain-containing protein [Verrucomicrobiota bacterium]